MTLGWSLFMQYWFGVSALFSYSYTFIFLFKYHLSKKLSKQIIPMVVMGVRGYGIWLASIYFGKGSWSLWRNTTYRLIRPYWHYLFVTWQNINIHFSLICWQTIVVDNMCIFCARRTTARSQIVRSILYQRTRNTCPRQLCAAICRNLQALVYALHRGTGDGGVRMTCAVDATQLNVILTSR